MQTQSNVAINKAREQAQYDTFSLGEMFKETAASGLWLVLDCGGSTLSFATHAGDTWASLDAAIQSHIKHDKINPAERVALVTVSDDNPARSHGLVFVKLRTGLYRQVGAPNHGHIDGVFKRHDKKRENWKQREAAKKGLDNMMSLGARQHTHA